MSYRNSWAHTFKADELIPKNLGSGRMPTVCDITGHAPYCLRADGPPFDALGTYGEWSLIDILNLPSILTGTKRKLLTASIIGLVEFTGPSTSSSSLRLIVDSAEAYNHTIFNGEVDWKKNTFTLSEVDIESAVLLDAVIKQRALGGIIGSVTKHDAKLTLTAEYYTDIPPVTAPVKITVKDSESNALIDKAYVAIMSGERIEAEGYTDKGIVQFEGIVVGSYELLVQVSGYRDFTQAINVQAPSTLYNVKIVKIPAAPLPSWLVPLGVGVAVLGTILVISPQAKEKLHIPQMPQIVVVR